MGMAAYEKEKRKSGKSEKFNAGNEVGSGE